MKNPEATPAGPSMRQRGNRSPRHTIGRGWRFAQATTLAGAVGVVALLVWRPAVGLWLTWDLLIPLVPAVLLLSPQLWRNLCPIATVHQFPALLGRGRRDRVSHAMQRSAPAIAGLLLFAIVPLRLVLFNESGPALAVFVLAVLAVGLAAGWFVTGKGGWCASFCPVLPVERLYGQSPLIRPSHAHCATCTGCLRACYDLAPQSSLQRLITPPRAQASLPLSRHSLARARDAAAPDPVEALNRTPMGLFTLAFPGFIIGYFNAPASPTLLQAYGWVVAGAALSAIVLAWLQRRARIPNATLTRIAAAGAIALYYWFTVPAVAAGAHEMFALPDAPALGIAMARAFTLAGAAAWLLRATQRAHRPPLQLARRLPQT